MSSNFHSLKQSLRWMIDNPYVLNWGPVERCILIFIFFIGVKILWIAWKLYILLNVDVQQFVHLSVVKFQLNFELIQIVVAALLIIALSFLKGKKKIEDYVPYFCVNLFAITLLFDAYTAGVFGSNTMVNTACYVFVGIILFNNRVMGSVVLLSTLCFAIIIGATSKGDIAYGPIFNFKTIGEPSYLNSFWLNSTSFFSFPILIACVAILMLILKQWRERENYIAYLSEFDALTGIYNRRMLNLALAELDRNRHLAQMNAMIMIDLDDFKDVNDTHGHLVGDLVLENTAETLKNAIRDSDVVGRFGGEEFLIILKNTSIEKTQLIAERCHDALQQIEHLSKDQIKFKVSGSMGVAFMQQGELAMNSLHEADLALYRAKSSGRNKICYAPH